MSDQADCRHSDFSEVTGNWVCKDCGTVLAPSTFARCTDLATGARWWAKVQGATDHVAPGRAPTLYPETVEPRP